MNCCSGLVAAQKGWGLGTYHMCERPTPAPTPKPTPAPTPKRMFLKKQSFGSQLLAQKSEVFKEDTPFSR